MSANIKFIDWYRPLIHNPCTYLGSLSTLSHTQNIRLAWGGISDFFIVLNKILNVLVKFVKCHFRKWLFSNINR